MSSDVPEGSLVAVNRAQVWFRTPDSGERGGGLKHPMHFINNRIVSEERAHNVIVNE